MVDPMTMKRFEYEHVVEKWGVPPNKLGDVLALAGDASDNIPGVPMIGPKIAASLINEFGGLEALLEKADTIPQKGRRERLMENKDKVSDTPMCESSQHTFSFRTLHPFGSVRPSNSTLHF
jgi:DNA polymerase-1